MTQRAYLVFNPVAGTVDPESAYRTIADHFTAVGWEYDIYRTTGEESIPDVVRKARTREDYDVVVAVGGDGTVSGVAGALVASEVPLGILPTGSGNALARELQIPLGLQDALDLLTGAHGHRTIDGMEVQGQHYFLSVSVGLSSLTMKDTGREEKRSFGWLAYIWTGLGKLFGHQPAHFLLTVDGQEQHWSAAEVVVANSGAIGMPAFQWGPGIRLDDGHLDVCVVRARSLVDYVRVAASVVLGRQRPTPHIHCQQADQALTVKVGRGLPIQADGEIIGRSHVTVTLEPQAVTLIVPE